MAHTLGHHFHRNAGAKQCGRVSVAQVVYADRRYRFSADFGLHGGQVPLEPRRQGVGIRRATVDPSENRGLARDECKAQ